MKKKYAILMLLMAGLAVSAGYAKEATVTSALPGANADPHIVCFDGTYYIYPTTDGFDGWDSSSFSCWSSEDLVHWENEGVILDFKKDLKWANNRAWAPCIAHANGKYCFYFSAEQQIGVAVSDKPTGPFEDPLGKPLIARGAYGCQVIDPMVFMDNDGSAYLYFGSGGCNVVKLNEDMVSFPADQVKRITPKGYCEGAFMMKRKGLYYLMWSSYDTRDPRYCVNYATGPSPMGPFTLAGHNPILKQKGSVKAAGHHSVVQAPDKDQWYIAYHRFQIPDGNGYNREVCISPMRFDTDGAIEAVDVFEPAYAYLMPYFGPQEKLYYSYSYDARNWKALNNGKPVWSPPFVRDPFINRVNGKFHLVHTTGWSGTTIGHWESDDLINWTGGEIEVIDKSRQRCWAPEFSYSRFEEVFYVYWASVYDGHSAMHYLKTKDWNNIKPDDSAIYYDIGIHDIDLTITEHHGNYYGFHKTGDVNDKMGNRLSISKSLDPSKASFAKDGHGKVVFSDESKPTEGPEVIKLIGREKWYIYGDPFGSPMEAWETNDFITFKKIKVTTPGGAKHCSMIPVTHMELEALLRRYSDQEETTTELRKYTDISSSKAAKKKVDLFLRPFDLKDVRLLDGPFKDAQDLHRTVLLKYEPDRLLSWFRKEAGLQSKAKVYEGWENKGIAGHTLGHYLSGCSLMYASTGDDEFKKRVNYIVRELAVCQNADGDGYIGAVKNGKMIFTEEVAKGNIRSQGFDLNGMWVPFYTQHKIYNGLRDAYRICNNQEALVVSKGFADWLETVVGHLNDEEMQSVLACEHGGMNESLADLYADTGDERYLAFARKFHHKAILSPLSKGVDCLPGKHANTQIPKLVGLAHLYELTGNEKDRETAEFFWDRVVYHHSYVTGGHCINEHFGPPDKLNDRLGPNTTETCNVYNMLKLSRHLIQWGYAAKAGDFYERALFNHVFGTQHPGDGRVIYNLTLEMGGFKLYQDPFGFTCCVGTGMENHAKYGESIYFHGDDCLYVNLFIASELNWKDKGLIIRQTTNFPDTDSSTLIFTCKKPTELAVQYRCPYWAQQGVLLTINGKEQQVNIEPGALGTIRRTWKTGDRLYIRIPMNLRLETMPDNKDRVAIMHGPLVLAGDLGEVNEAKASRPDLVPVLVTEHRDPLEWIRSIENKPNTFQTVNVGRPGDVTLTPFFRMHDRRYSIYWDMYTEKRWKMEQTARKEVLEELKKLEAMTIDFVQPGEMQPERDHNLKGEHTSAGQFKGHKWRHAHDGWFSFDIKVLPDEPVTIQATYWGSDAGDRIFDVLVDNIIVATQTLENNKPDKFYVENYNIPFELTQKKNKVTIRFQSQEGKVAGGLFGVRVMRTKKRDNGITK
jgi:uncharacterized protein